MPSRLRAFRVCAFLPSLLEHSYRPYPDAGQFGTRTPKGDITITTRVQGVTVGAAPFFQGTAILHVLSNAIRVLEPGTLRRLQTILC